MLSNSSSRIKNSWRWALHSKCRRLDSFTVFLYSKLELSKKCSLSCSRFVSLITEEGFLSSYPGPCGLGFVPQDALPHSACPNQSRVTESSFNQRDMTLAVSQTESVPEPSEKYCLLLFVSQPSNPFSLTHVPGAVLLFLGHAVCLTLTRIRLPLAVGSECSEIAMGW